VYTARACTSVLRYEARSFVPTKTSGCHAEGPGYCGVISPGRAQATRSGHARVTRAPPREQNGLLEWLEDRPVTTFSALRRQPFTLRLLQ
jgi:hypothetical protein